MNGEWKRVTKKEPCKTCGKPDWCCLSTDGAVANCMRIESPKLCKNGGWLHRLTDAPERHDFKRPEPPLPRTVRWDLLLKQFEPKNGEVEKAAALLGVTAESLRMLGMGFDGEAHTFPMQNAFGSVVGIRRRFLDGRKLSVTGGKEGLFVPNCERQNPVFICEGPTDTAAILSLGLYAIGQPSCRGNHERVQIVVADSAAIIIADNDGPGRDGANALATYMASHHPFPFAKVISPPAGIKDARQWLKAGMTRKDLDEAAR